MLGRGAMVATVMGIAVIDDGVGKMHAGHALRRDDVRKLTANRASTLARLTQARPFVAPGGRQTRQIGANAAW